MRIRQISADERGELMFPLVSYAFEPTASGGAAGQERYRARMRYLANVVNLVAEEDGVAKACAAALPMRQNVRGVVLPMAGVSSVASEPGSRRRGFVRDLMWRLLGDMRDAGCAVSALYPFRASFYARSGFAGLPKRRWVTFAPEGIDRVGVPGSVERVAFADGFEEYVAFTERLLGERHGFALYDDLRTEEFREQQRWLALARDGDGGLQGALAYEIKDFGSDLVGRDLLAAGPVGRALLLQFLGRHVDQVKSVGLSVGADVAPELWGTDMTVVTEGRVEAPARNAPMARVLRLEALDGVRVGAGGVDVEVVDDRFVAGVHRLEGDGGRLRVGRGRDPRARLTVAGLSALVYGVLDPEEVVLRGLGTVEPDAAGSLRALFPRAWPYLFADF